MNASKPPPPPPQRLGGSRPPTPPLARGGASTNPPAANGSQQTPTLDSNRPVPPSVPSQPSLAQGSPAPSVGFETRVRVSVKFSVRDPQLVLARPLAPGQAPPPGTREAFLVLADAGVPDGRNGGEGT
jgi:hypothetical protein